MDYGSGKDPCLQNDPSNGISRLYALDYRTGAAVYDCNGDDKVDKDDRSKTILEDLVSIAPSPKIFITSRGAELMVGPHSEDPVSGPGGVRRFYWKIDE